MTDELHILDLNGWCKTCESTGEPGIRHLTPFPNPKGWDIPVVSPDPLQPTQQEIAVPVAVIAPIIRRMAIDIIKAVRTNIPEYVDISEALIALAKEQP